MAFRTWGQGRSQYPNRSWKIYRNTPSFVPKPGDIVCWTYGWAGHTAIVVGPSDKHTLNVWIRTVGSNQWSGSRAAFVNHNYNGNGGNIYFIRPPYKAEKTSKPSNSSNSSSSSIRQQTTIKQSQSKETNAHQFHY